MKIKFKRSKKLMVKNANFWERFAKIKLIGSTWCEINIFNLIRLIKWDVKYQIRCLVKLINLFWSELIRSFKLFFRKSNSKFSIFDEPFIKFIWTCKHQIRESKL